MKTLKRASLLAVSLLLAVPYDALPALTRVGAAAAVSGSVLAMAPESGEGVKAGVGRELSSGKTIYHNDKISTDAKGRMQVMLLDETVFTIGPNSEMYIDEFVYDPSNADKNKVTARVTKGVFRFVTGKVAAKEPQAMKVKLPVGTIGIRGTIAGGSVGPDGTLVALLGPGANNDAGEKQGGIIVQGANTQEIYASNNGVTINPEGTVSDPAPLTQQQQQQLSTEPPPSGEGSGTTTQGQTASAQQTSSDQAQDSSGSGGTAGESATAAAAADTSETQTSGAETALTNSDTQLFQNETNTASQNTALGTAAILDGVAQWVDLRTVPTGAGHLEGSGSYSCSGCGTGGSANAFFRIGINFETKQLGYGADPLGCPNLVQLTGSINQTANITGTVNYGSPDFTGNAVFTLINGSTSDNQRFDNTTITLVNQGGVAAHHAELDLKYSDSQSGISATTPTPIVSGTLTP